MSQPLGVVQIDNRHGSVDLKLPAHAGFDLQASTTDGDLKNDFDLPVQGSDTQKSSSGTVGSGGAVVRLTTAQGDISIQKSDIGPLPPKPPNPPEPPKKPSKSGITHPAAETTF